MQKTILITGSTDGIGLETARMLVGNGHVVLLHGRDPAKLQETAAELAAVPNGGPVEPVLADLSRLDDVERLADNVIAREAPLDVLINNAGVLKAPNASTPDGVDLRFVVNAIAPYLLTRRLLPLLGRPGRVVNLSSAAQATVDLAALTGPSALADMEAYSQSKLAITMWSWHMARTLGETGPVVVAVNPGSLLASKMVKEGFGIAGNDIRIGADILVRAALSDEFATATGLYYDNDAGSFGPPHPDAHDAAKAGAVVDAIEAHIASRSSAA